MVQMKGNGGRWTERSFYSVLVIPETKKLNSSGQHKKSFLWIFVFVEKFAVFLFQENYWSPLGTKTWQHAQFNFFGRGVTTVQK